MGEGGRQKSVTSYLNGPYLAVGANVECVRLVIDGVVTLLAQALLDRGFD